MRRRTLFLGGGLALLLLLLAGGMAAASVSRAPRDADLRGADGRLRPCPASPNCVCSEASTGAAGDAEHAIAPLLFRGPADAAWAALAAVLAEWPRVRVVLAGPDYVHAEFTSLVFRFTDDVEFRLDAAAGAIQVRSASRVGHSDLGANRRRVEALRAALAERLGPGAAPQASGSR